MNGNRNMKSARKQRIQRYFRIKLLKYYRAIKVKKGEQSQKNTPTANINTLLWDNQNHLILKFSKLDVVAIQITLSETFKFQIKIALQPNLYIYNLTYNI